MIIKKKIVKILIAGVAGFGFKLAERLLKDNHNIYSIDNLKIIIQKN